MRISWTNQVRYACINESELESFRNRFRPLPWRKTHDALGHHCENTLSERGKEA